MTLLRRCLGSLFVVVMVAGVPPAAAEETDPVGEWPLRPQPRVEGWFDAPTTRYGRGHRGVDLLGSFGQPVHAALPGKVSHVGRIAGRGTVTVTHGDTRTTYEPVVATVTTGQEVSSGAVIGRLERVGSHCMPRVCLHWGWIRGEEYLDPLRLVGGGPIRLLPLWRDEPVAHSGARVSLLERASQAIGGDVGVALGRREGRVSEEFLD